MANYGINISRRGVHEKHQKDYGDAAVYAVRNLRNVLYGSGSCGGIYR